MKRAPAVVALIVLAVTAGCAPGGGPILAGPTVAPPSLPPPSPRPEVAVDPQPIVLPRDDGPHDRLTEWWYYTGHLDGRTPDGQPRDLGFEYVIFRAERGDFPTTWAAHLAITDETGERFRYAQRTEVGPGVDRSPRDAAGEPLGFDLALTGLDPRDPATAGRPAWSMRGTGGLDVLSADLAEAELAAAGLGGPLGLELRTRAATAAVLHDRDGWIDFGPAGGSYYYSRPDLVIDGALTIDGTTVTGSGIAWFDHQWGDFISVGGGGWDWFAVNLDDGTDLTVSLVRDADGSYPLVYGTLVAPDGSVRHLERDAFTVEVDGTWDSPRTGARYPSGWTIRIPDDGLVVELDPTVADQELDTRASTGVIYWEGSQDVRATRDGVTLGGEAYVELTGYAAAAAPIGP